MTTSTPAAADAPTVTIMRHPAAPPMPAEERAARSANASFGTAFTEHMVSIHWNEARGWYDAELLPLQPVQLHPATVGLHYGQSVFEGLKAYRQTDGAIAVFRPIENARRFRRSARRLVMPELPEDLFVRAIEELVRQDAGWVPSERGHSLYLRPLLLATEASLALRPAREYRFLLLAFPTSSFFAGGRPVTVWVSQDYVRAAPGGTGEAKCAGNYAAGYLAQAQAAAMAATRSSGSTPSSAATSRRWAV